MPAMPAAWRELEQSARQRRRATARMRAAVRRRAAAAERIDPAESAKVAGLRYVDEQTRGIRRAGRAPRFRYVGPDGRPVKDADTLARIRSLAIPPAWTDVWICPRPEGHLQATGRDARGRKQYRYHPRWCEVRDEVKYGRLIAFAQALPAIRRRAAADLRRPGLPREKVLAAVVQLLEKTLIRVGNEEYARANHSFGLTTMRDEHARIGGGRVRFQFRGKSGIQHAIELDDARLARVIKACRDLPGYELFQYVDEHGVQQAIDSADVNAYVREISGEDFTAKDFRTWAGTVLAAQALAVVELSRTAAQAKRTIARAIEDVAKRLGNTKAVCRKSYIHPAILEAYVNGATIATVEARAERLRARGALSAEESAVVDLITARLRTTSSSVVVGRPSSATVVRSGVRRAS